MKKGKVYLIGGGPGDPGLVTLRGHEILRQADVVIYDYLVDKRILEEAKEGAELVCCDTLGPSTSLPSTSLGMVRTSASLGTNAEHSRGIRGMVSPPNHRAHGEWNRTIGPSTSLRAHGERNRTIGKKRYSDGFLIHNEKINRLVIKKVKEGKRVVRLKNGDPGIFSRTSQELGELVKEGIEFEIVPGVTAASAASCLSGIPLTDRRYASSCVFATGHEDPAKKMSSHDWAILAKSGTLVLYMGVENLPKIVKELTEAGKGPNTGVAIIQDASLLTQKVLIGTLKDIAEKAGENRIMPPAIIIIGDVVRLEKRFDWLKKTRRILFTGLSKERFFMKGKYFHLPLIKIEPMGSYREFDSHLKNIRQFDWIVFSSRYGVEYFFRRLKAIGHDSRILHGIKIAAIGNSTKDRLSDFEIIADLVPSNESSKGLLEEFKKIDLRGKKIFLPRSDISDKNLSDGFKRLEADVVTGFAYRNVMVKDLPDLELSSFDEVIFTSPSGVRSFIKRYKRLPKGVRASYIGDVTRREAKRCNLVD